MSEKYWNKRWNEVLEDEHFLRHALQAAPNFESLEFFCQQLPDGGRVLDFGCGSGRNSVYLSSEGYYVYAEDIAWGAISVLEQLVREKTVPPVTTRQSQHGELEYPDNNFDGILVWNVFDHMSFSEGKEIVPEMARVLKKGGTLYATFEKREDDIEEDFVELEDNSLMYVTGKMKDMVISNYSEKEIRDLFRDFSTVRFLSETDKNIRVIAR